MVKTGSESDSDQHYSPSVRVCDVARPSSGSCGFHLTRSKWDPYPWVSAVDSGSAAEAAGLHAGDCVLEVNGEDVLGQRIGEVASKVRAKDDSFTLLLWNSGSDPQCTPESLCCGPMPSNLQRLSACMSSILAALECPICLDTIPPPAHQCGNGHLICLKCRVKTERCPICRVRFCRARSLLADQVFNSLTEAFEVKDEAEGTKPAKLRERLFGPKKIKYPQHPDKITPELKFSFVSTPTNKFLTRILGKSSSVENLSSNPVHLSAMPRHLSAVIDAEFSSSLKAKSLSTSEICQPIGSRPVSRTPSARSINRAGNDNNGGFLNVSMPLDFKRSASYHGSCESLERRIRDDFYERVQPEDNSLYFCPCDGDCSALITAQKVLTHIQEFHEGPLVHYFKSKLYLTLPLSLQDTSVIAITHDGKTFFMKVVQQFPDDYLIWLWMLGSKEEAESYNLEITLKGDEKELSYQSRSRSLCSDSWKDICQNRSGVFISAQVLAENFPLEAQSGTAIKMEVEVKSR